MKNKYIVTLVYTQKAAKRLKEVFANLEGEQFKNPSFKNITITKGSKEIEAIEDTFVFTNRLVKEKFISYAIEIFGEELLDIKETRDLKR